MKFEKTVEGIRKAIKSVVNRGTSWQNDVQSVALACLEHTKEHGNWTLSVELIDGITQVKGVKHTQLKMYFEAMMCATFDTDGEGKSIFTYDKGHNQNSIDMAMCEAVNWFDFKAPKANNAKNMDELIETFIKNIDKSVKAKKVSDAERDDMINLLATYTATADVESVLKAVA